MPRLPELIDFPRTPHLFGSRPGRDDKVLSETETDAMLAGPLVVQEKVDGSNVGLSLDDAGQLLLQNRAMETNRLRTEKQ